MSNIPVCRDCGAALGQQAEKALSGEVQMVWANVLDGDWVCPKTGDEHVQVYRVPRVIRPVTGSWIVVEGNPRDGFVFHGIPAFETSDEANEWATENCTRTWWVAPLQDVE